MGRILRINLTEETILTEETRQDWAKSFVGGAGLATKYLCRGDDHV